MNSRCNSGTVLVENDSAKTRHAQTGDIGFEPICDTKRYLLAFFQLSTKVRRSSTDIVSFFAFSRNNSSLTTIIVSFLVVYLIDT